MKSQKYMRVLWEEKIKNKLYEEEECKNIFGENVNLVKEDRDVELLKKNLTLLMNQKNQYLRINLKIC